VTASDPEDIWKEKGPQYAAPLDEVRQALAGLLACDWRTVWDKNTRAPICDLSTDWYLNRQEGLLAWANYPADFQLRQTGKTSFTSEDYFQFRLFDEVKRVGRDALSDEYFHDFRDYEFAMNNQEFIHGLSGALTNEGRSPNIEFLWFCFLWDRFTIPFQFWTNEAIAGYYRAKTGDDGTQFNKERIRNWKRLLRLKEASPFLVRGWDDANKRLKFEKRREILKRIHKVHGIPIPNLPDA
jgi:hypothetical protein